MKIVLTSFVIFIILILLEIRRELSFFKSVKYEIKVPGLKEEKTVVFLSDLHNHEYGNKNEGLLKAIRKEQPDLILVGGDMLVSKSGHSFQVAYEFVKYLPDICPVYCANGNHEQRMKIHPERYDISYAKYQEQLIKDGVHFLENDSAYLYYEKINVKITGLEIPLRCYTHFRKENMETQEIVDRIGEKEAGVFEILLAHNPSYMKHYLERGADLILCGHLHGGIVRIPGVAGAISPSFEIFPRYSGDHYRKADTDIVVSKGLGTHTFNIRLFNPAEIVVLKLQGEKEK